MPSSFSSEFAAAAVSDLLSQFGHSVTYTTAAGVESTIYGIFHEDMTDSRDTPDGREVVRSGTIRISDDADLDTYAGVAAPAEDDTVNVEGVDWNVDRVGEHNGGFWTLELGRIESIEKTQAGYRDEA
jgi:hypothetical protein